MRIKERYQLAAELGERYWAAGRRERGVMLDAFCLTTGYSRKYAISILRGRQRMPRLRAAQASASPLSNQRQSA